MKRYVYILGALVVVALLGLVVWRERALEERVSRLEAAAQKSETKFVEFQGHAYLAVANPMRWVQAKEYAEKLGGYLAVVTTDKENKFVADLMDSQSIYGAFWIGLSDEEQEGVWKWVNGEPYVENYFWEPGEPNGGRYENYVVIGHLSKYRWNDATDWARQPFVVEFDSIKNFKGLPK
jgi:hypothetical protein